MIAAGSGRNIALTGVPRSGTTLCCRLLGQADDSVALLEPMEVHLLASDDRGAALDEIARFFQASRQSLLADGTAWSEQAGGSVPDNPFADERGGDGQRRRDAVRGKLIVDKPLRADFTLVVKHPAAFTALLPELAQRLETFAVVRNPLAVLASWHSLALPISRGRMPAAERLDAPLAQRLQGIVDCIDRQLAILDWMFARYRDCLPRAHVVRYEDVVASAGAVLAQATGVAVPPIALQPRNASHLYDAALCAQLAARLLRDQGAWRHFYAEADVHALALRLAGAG